MKHCFAILLALLPLCSRAANHYIRDGGSGDGAAWNNALDDLPATLTRGDTYYIADGTYGAYTFNDAESSTSVITIKKATVADHGTSTGWSDAYGDGEAVFTSAGRTWTFSNGYYLIDGQVGSGTSGYGIRVTSTASRAATNEMVGLSGTIGSTVLNDLVLKYIDFDWNNGTGTSSSGVTRAFDNAIITTDGMTFSHCYVHDSSGFAFGFFYGDTTDLTIEHCVFANNGGGGGEAAHWELFWFTQVTNLTFRYNIVRDVIGQQGQTGWLMVGDCSNVKIHGNVFYNTSGSAWTGNNGTIATWSNNEFANTNVYIVHNTFVDLPVSTSEPSINFFHNSADDTNVVAKNNLFYNSVFNFAGVDTSTHNAFGGGQGTSGSSTQTGLSSSIFTDYSGDDFTLASNTTAGDSGVGSEYNTDMLGNARTTQSRGAYEFQSEGGGGGGGTYAPTRNAGAVLNLLF